MRERDISKGKTGPREGATEGRHLPAPDASPARNRPEDEHISGNGRVLLMDDEEMARIVTGELLSGLGYEVVAVPDGGEAVRAYRRASEEGNPFDAVIMDLTVPGGMGGVETPVRLREFDPGVRAVVYSGYSSDPVMSDYGRYGFRGRLAKPFRLGELGRVVRDVVSGR
jgi:CheY-like chemotaxis protein